MYDMCMYVFMLGGAVGSEDAKKVHIPLHSTALTCDEVVNLGSGLWVSHFFPPLNLACLDRIVSAMAFATLKQ